MRGKVWGVVGALLLLSGVAATGLAAFYSGVPDRLNSRIDLDNANFPGSKPSEKSLRVELTRRSNGDFEVTLTNVGRKPVDLYNPSPNYTLSFDLFDRAGKPLEPTCDFAITLPNPSRTGFNGLPPGATLTTEIDHATIKEGWAAHDEPAILSVRYESSDFVKDAGRRYGKHVDEVNVASHVAQW